MIDLKQGDLTSSSLQRL